MIIPDAVNRETALDTSRSFIVQAPAGSGKTELLIQRYLALLAGVEEPEEIISITFTRKAAAEMRRRILRALDRGKHPEAPAESHAMKTWTLARAALHQNDRRGWRITQNPSRLKIQTIDSLCAGLTRQMPCLSRFGIQPQITERPEALYRQAARNMVADLESGAAWSPAIAALVQHLDNHLARIEALVARMLAKRDQWLRHVLEVTAAQAAVAPDDDRLRESLEAALTDIVTAALQSVRDQFPRTDFEDLLSGARFAGGNLKKQGSGSRICLLDKLQDLPEALPSALDQWLGLADLMLTGNNSWRKRMDKNTGFPAPGSVSEPHLKHLCQQHKETFTGYLQRLHGEDGLADALAGVRILPNPAYSDEQWDIMAALFEILKVAVAHLELVFQGTGKVDFAEIGLRAKTALGEPETATDLALALDYRISHILMDEFQDTSFTQFELVERLTAGWTGDDGRTFFAVGDPMQSIYAFREAEVGLFLNAWQYGLAQVDLTPLVLSVNFRSQKGIIDWVNDHFPIIMPRTSDITTGRVPYSPSKAFHPELPGPSVTVHAFIPSDRAAEADRVVECVRKTRQTDPDGTIAILVRGRTHLYCIVPALKNAGLSFQAVEIDSLKNRPVISDLLSLTRALTHPADRIAWLSVLRAPWCGLTLHDLHVLAGEAPGRTMMSLMADPERLGRLTPDGQARLAAVKDPLISAVLNRHRKPLRRLVEGIWLGLGGPACMFDSSELEDVGAFLDEIDRLEARGAGVDMAELEAAAASLYARPDNRADERLQIMTIHKAKGLEFDTVILPALERQPPAEESQLLLWLERAAGDQRDLLLAPIAETGAEKDKIYKYIEKIKEEKREWEDSRLLYVAATRAKKRLHFMGGVKVLPETGEIRNPLKKSLLSTLWPAVSEQFYQMAQSGTPVLGLPADTESDGEDDEKLSPVVVPYIRRLSAEWKLPLPPLDVVWQPPAGKQGMAAMVPGMPEFKWASEAARHVGIVVHFWLKAVCEEGLEGWDAARIGAMNSVFKADLIRSGMDGESVEAAVSQVQEALINALTDARGKWILSRHAGGACEYALTGKTDDGIVSVVMDRTFIDETGVRWIIDYKTGTHRGGSMDEFLDHEKERYEEQLDTYAALMRAREDREIRLGLYFPLIKGWREWAAQEDSPSAKETT
ncbi:MAG: DNA helicase UvrD [Desulfobacteraceae bacterium]|nr:MAG: DNA helicase UvrD [Desulfobacteraceae bacterium]